MDAKRNVPDCLESATMVAELRAASPDLEVRLASSFPSLSCGLTHFLSLAGCDFKFTTLGEVCVDVKKRAGVENCDAESNSDATASSGATSFRGGR